MFCASHELCGERVPLLRYFYPNTVKTRCLRGSAFLARLCLPKLPAYLLEFANFLSFFLRILCHLKFFVINIFSRVGARIQVSFAQRQKCNLLCCFILPFKICRNILNQYVHCTLCCVGSYQQAPCQQDTITDVSFIQKQRTYLFRVLLEQHQIWTYTWCTKCSAKNLISADKFLSIVLKYL